jgi:hypothetical protein
VLPAMLKSTPVIQAGKFERKTEDAGKITFFVTTTLSIKLQYTLQGKRVVIS